MLDVQDKIVYYDKAFEYVNDMRSKSGFYQNSSGYEY